MEPRQIPIYVCIHNIHNPFWSVFGKISLGWWESSRAERKLKIVLLVKLLPYRVPYYRYHMKHDRVTDKDNISFLENPSYFVRESSALTMCNTQQLDKITYTCTASKVTFVKIIISVVSTYKLSITEWSCCRENWWDFYYTVKYRVKCGQGDERPQF